ncbi:MAG: DUF975 family protein [Vagococcus sp.]
MYQSSREMKEEARRLLNGRWKEAMLLNIVPVVIQILGGIIVWLSTPIGKNIFGIDLSVVLSNRVLEPIITFLLTLLTVGISFTFLDVVRKGSEQTLAYQQSFRIFNQRDFIPVLLINVLTQLFASLWALLLLIPGIVKHYSYSQANFIYKDLATHTDVKTLNATSFITQSRELMNGHKERLFWLDISFIGWHIFGIVTFGFGYLYVTPYINMTRAIFYDDLSKGQYLQVDKEEIELDEGWELF